MQLDGRMVKVHKGQNYLADFDVEKMRDLISGGSLNDELKLLNDGLSCLRGRIDAAMERLDDHERAMSIHLKMINELQVDRPKGDLSLQEQIDEIKEFLQSVKAFKHMCELFLLDKTINLRKDVDGLEKTLDEFKSEVYYTLNGIKYVLSGDR